MNVKNNNIIQCPSCLFQFSSINWLIQHLRQIKNVCFCAEQYPCNTFCCKFCPLNLQTANELADHLEVFHCQTENNCEVQELNSCINEDNTHRIFNYCKFCTKYFKRNSDLQRHELIHTGERPFKCSQCFLSFRTKQTLQTHQKTHLNTPSEQYQCSFCQKYFLSRSSLKLHLRIHTGEAPFKCQNEQCFEMFRTKKLMLTHYKNTHFEQFLQQNGQIIEKPINITEKQKSNIASLDNHFIALNELLKLNKKIGGPKKARKCLTQSENSAFSKFGINKKFDCRRGREIEEEEEEEEVVNEGFVNSFETINGGHEQIKTSVILQHKNISSVPLYVEQNNNNFSDPNQQNNYCEQINHQQRFCSNDLFNYNINNSVNNKFNYSNNSSSSFFQSDAEYSNTGQVHSFNLINQQQQQPLFRSLTPIFHYYINDTNTNEIIEENNINVFSG